MKKIFSFLLVGLMGLTLAAGCKDDPEECPGMTLEDVNAFLNDKENMNMNLANTVAIIPFNHINGPRSEWKFYALVNFQYKENTYVKYQVTFLSCTCRAARVNYWSTAYVELSLPKYPENAKVRDLSFDLDSEDHYTAGFWGDSNPIYDEATGEQIIATYDKYMDAREVTVTIGENTYKVNYDESRNVTSLSKGKNTYAVSNGQVTIDETVYTLTVGEDTHTGYTDVVTSLVNGENVYETVVAYKGLDLDIDGDEVVDGNYYPTLKYQYIEDLIIGKTRKQIDSYNVMDDMVTNNAMSEELFDAFTGASVSTNNILRMLHALFEYHENTWYKAE